MPGVHRRSELIEYALTDDQMREGGPHLRAIDLMRHRCPEGVHVLAILFQGNGRAADVVALLEKQHCPRPADVCDPVAVRRCTERPARDLDLMLLFDGSDDRL